MTKIMLHVLLCNHINMYSSNTQSVKREIVDIESQLYDFKVQYVQNPNTCTSAGLTYCTVRKILLRLTGKIL